MHLLTVRLTSKSWVDMFMQQCVMCRRKWLVHTHTKPLLARGPFMRILDAQAERAGLADEFASRYAESDLRAANEEVL